MLRFLLFPFSLVYGLIVHLRNLLFDLGIFKSYSPEIKTIVVGNLSVGGSGKSPMVEYLVRLLKEDYKVAVLSRGYGRKTKGFILANKDSTANQIGDEPKQIANKFPNVQIAVCEDRTYGIKELQKLDFDVILLDDAFQHRKVKGGFNILLTPYYNLFYKDYYLPFGTLRDAKNQHKRADTFVVTKCPESIDSQESKEIQTRINSTNPQNVFFSEISYDSISSETEEYSTSNLNVSNLKNIILVTGIANSDPLVEYLNTKYNIINHVKYRDHYVFVKNDLQQFQNLLTKFVKHDPIIITTEKDFVKIKPLLKDDFRELPIVQLPIKSKFISRKNEFDAMILNYLKK